MNKLELLEQLKVEIEGANLPLKDSATNMVFGRGNINPQILFIGEAPGANEDLQGLPFVGAAGKNLDKIIEKASISTDSYYIANILKYRPPNNRDPNIDEIKSHTPYLVKQIKILKPKVIVTLGNYATKFVLANFSSEIDKIDGITKVHGKFFDKKLDDLEFKVMPIYHPAAIIYNRGLQKDFEDDFIRLSEFLKQKTMF